MHLGFDSSASAQPLEARALEVLQAGDMPSHRTLPRNDGRTSNRHLGTLYPPMSVQREIDWKEPLVRPIKVKGRRSAIRTREQAAEYILALPVSRQHRRNWIAAATALNSGAAIDIVHRLMVKAIGSDGDLG